MYDNQNGEKEIRGNSVIINSTSKWFLFFNSERYETI